MKIAKQILEKLSDAQLIGLVEGGNNNAFDTLVLRYRGRLHHYLHALLHNSELEKDVSQNVWVDVLMKIRKHLYGNNSIFEKLLNTIAFRKAIKAKRKEQRFVHGERPEQAVSPSSDESFFRHENVKLINEQLEKMNPNMRDVVKMRIQDDLPFKVIAAKKNITVGAATSTFTKAMQKLKRIFSKSKKRGSK